MPAFDQVDGGFGGAPKFPHPANLDALLRHAVAAHDDAARDAVLLTLRRMAEGGLYDHLGGGFCRYSTDARWMIPHFEKMLYDNGPLLRLYAASLAAHRRTAVPPGVRGDGRLADARDASRRRRLSSPASMPTPKARRAASTCGSASRWRSSSARPSSPRSPRATDSTRRPTSKATPGTCTWPGRWPTWPARLGRDEAECAALIADARADLFALREARVRPGRDDKVLTSWNALAIDGMAFAARVFGRARLGGFSAPCRGVRPAQRCGATAACWPRARTAARTSTPTSTTMPSCSAHCSSSCKVEPAACRRSAIGPCALAELLLAQFEDAQRWRLLLHQPRPRSAGAAPEVRVTTAPRRRATAWPHCICSDWVI